MKLIICCREKIISGCKCCINRAVFSAQADRNGGAAAGAGGGAAAAGGGNEAESLSASEASTQREAAASQHSECVLPERAAKHTQVRILDYSVFMISEKQIS